MFLESKKVAKTDSDAISWRPSASLTALRQRAEILIKIREFFLQHGVYEVETPVLGQYAVTDLNLESFAVPIITDPMTDPAVHYYLQTSPEYAMKRLLAAGSGSIYQICKAFRRDEAGRFHNPEFSLLEWYRVGFDHMQLMDEVDQLVGLILNTPPAQRITYQQLFLDYLHIDVYQCSLPDLHAVILQQAIMVNDLDNMDRDMSLQLLLSHCIEPRLGKDAPIFVYDFPASQAALAKIRFPVAERFELYINGMEIANGFHELTDADEQQQRFCADQCSREQRSQAIGPIDTRLLAALTHGLPDCAGVALGLDRLVLLALGATHLQEVISFTWSNA